MITSLASVYLPLLFDIATVQRGDATSAQLQVVRQLSTAQLGASSSARRVFNEHKDHCSDCLTQTRWSLCATGCELWEARIASHSAILRKWDTSGADWVEAYCPDEFR